MRFLIAAFSLALTTGAFAQTTPEPAQTTPQTPAPLAGMNAITQEHPEWFTEENLRYRPCPASVVFYPDRHHACLGCPTTCRWHQ